MLLRRKGVEHESGGFFLFSCGAMEIHSEGEEIAEVVFDAEEGSEEEIERFNESRKRARADKLAADLDNRNSKRSKLTDRGIKDNTENTKTSIQEVAKESTARTDKKTPSKDKKKNEIVEERIKLTEKSHENSDGMVLAENNGHLLRPK